MGGGRKEERRGQEIIFFNCKKKGHACMEFFHNKVKERRHTMAYKKPSLCWFFSFFEPVDLNGMGSSFSFF